MLAWSEDGMKRWFSIVSLVALFYGCSGKDDHPPISTEATGGRSNTGATGGRTATGGAKSSGGAGASVSNSGGAGAGGDGGVGGEGGGMEVDPLAPIVEITSPIAMSDPDDGEVLLEDNVDVLCHATKSTRSGSVGVNAASIKIAMLDKAGKQVKELAGTSTNDVDVYAARFAVANLTSGAVTFRCTASDLSGTPRTGSAQISTFVDRGPDITAPSPKAGLTLPLKGAVKFEFTVAEAPLADGDRGAEVSEVTLTVWGLPVEVAPAPDRDGVYVGTVDFTDATLFPEAPTGDIPVVMTAANSRKPTSALRTLGYTFKLDGDGPIIKINKPGVNQIVGPTQQYVEFTVADTPSGVDKNTVTVTLNGKPYVFEPPPSPWTEKNGTYTFKFNSSMLNGSIAEATINVHVVDNVGNKAEGQARVVYLDDYAPIVSLDPGLVRVASVDVSKTTCSTLFDPLGFAVNDGDTIKKAARFRALVWDLTNVAPGQDIAYYSGPDTGSVRLYVQPDISQPLLIDKDGDGKCDHVTTQDKNGVDLVLINLGPVEKGGKLPNSPSDLTAEPAYPGACSLSTVTPDGLCSDDASDMTYVVRHPRPGGETLVYARDPIPNDLACTGNTWEVPLGGHTGWICLAATASDLAQNEGISHPLRACVSDTCAGLPMPTCTDGCTPPPEFPSQLLVYH
jgi:hypothetical protein